MSRTIGQLVAERLPAIRQGAGVTQEQVARAAVRVGFAWRRLTVRDLESNARKLTVEEFAALPLILELAGCRTLRRGGPRLIQPGDVVDLTPRLAGVDGRLLARMLAHTQDPARLEAFLEAERADALAFAEQVLDREDDEPAVTVGDEAETKAAARLRQRLDRPGLTVDDVQASAAILWGRRLADERDARVGDGGGMAPRQLQAARGFTTRALLDELASWLTTGRKGGHGKHQKAR